MKIHAEVGHGMFMYRISDTERFLIFLARTEIEEAFPVKQYANIDWKRLFNLSIKHEVVSIVYDNCNKNDLFPDVAVKSLFNQEYSKRQKLRVIYEAVTDEINSFAKNKNIKFMYIKGYALNPLIYNNLRDFNDIDIAVDRDNFDKLVDMFLSLGFSFSFKTPKSVSKNIVKKIFNESSVRLFEFYKIIDDVTVCFDLHKIEKNSPECLDDAYINSVCDFGICIPKLTDSLIFSCYHAWHHYAYPFRIASQERGTILKDLMDIREIYTTLKNDNNEKNIYLYANKIGALSTLQEMLYLTEKIYGSFVSNNFKCNFMSAVKHDYFTEKYNSTFESRFFNGEAEKQKLISALGEHDLMSSSTDKMMCLYINDKDDSDIIENLFNKYSFSTLKNGFWINVYGSFSTNKYSQEAQIGLMWTDEYFISKIDVKDPFYHFGDSEYYDEIQDSINFIFPQKNNMKFSIQLKNSGEHKIFKAIQDNIIKCQLNNCIIKSFEYKNGYNVLTMIPWTLIDIVSPENNNEFELYINIKVGNDRDIGSQILIPFGMSSTVYLNGKNK